MIAEYLEYLTAEDQSPQTVRLRRVYLTQFIEEVPDYLDATPHSLAEYLSTHRAIWSDSTMNVSTSSLRGLYRWLHETGLKHSNPAANLSYVRSDLPVGRIAEDPDITRGLSRATPRQRLAILLMSQAGLRRAEVAALPASAVRANWLRVHGKGQKWRSIPILPDVAQALLDSPPVNGWYFPGRSNGGHVYDGTVADWSRFLVGMPPHALRRRYATQMYAATKDIKSVQLLLGHSSALVTERYIGVGMDRLQEVALSAIFAQSGVA